MSMLRCTCRQELRQCSDYNHRLNQGQPIAPNQNQFFSSPTGTTPTNTDSFTPTKSGTLSISTNPEQNSWCLSITPNSNSQSLPSFNITSDSGTIQEGGCPSPNIQTITKAACPTELTQVKDARDNNSYYIKKLGNDCWMLTNLAYAGGTSNGGTNTYSDVINQGTGTPGTPGTLNNGTADTERTFTLAKYYVHAAANPTIDPTPPSTDTTGGGSGAGRQYGYYYNWCAVMGGQNTAACANAETPAPDPTTNICPAGWRLPTGGSGGELEGLNTAINGGLTNTDAGLRTNGLFQRSGYWYNGFNNQGSYGYYWSISQYSSTSARSLYLGSTLVYPAYYSYKYNGFSVRCIAL